MELTDVMVAAKGPRSGTPVRNGVSCAVGDMKVDVEHLEKLLAELRGALAAVLIPSPPLSSVPEGTSVVETRGELMTEVRIVQRQIRACTEAVEEILSRLEV